MIKNFNNFENRMGNRRYSVTAAPAKREDRYTKITSPFLFKMKSTLQHIKRLLIED